MVVHTGAAAAPRAITGAVRSLTTKLRAAGSLPLRIVSVQPLSAAVRDTAAFPPLPHPLAAAGPAAGAGTGRMPRCLEPLELAVQLEGSGESTTNTSVSSDHALPLHALSLVWRTLELPSVLLLQDKKVKSR